LIPDKVLADMPAKGVVTVVGLIPPPPEGPGAWVMITAVICPAGTESNKPPGASVTGRKVNACASGNGSGRGTLLMFGVSLRDVSEDDAVGLVVAVAEVVDVVEGALG
jgi:hypothetical protein